MLLVPVAEISAPMVPENPETVIAGLGFTTFPTTIVRLPTNLFVPVKLVKTFEKVTVFPLVAQLKVVIG